MKRFRGLILLAVLIGGCFTAEVVSHRRVNPTGRVTTLRQYLAWQPSTDRFAATSVQGKHYLIAYGPRSSWLLLSSGPSACVFDDTGRLVDWSSDIGDDGGFNTEWNAQRAFTAARQLTRADAERLAATQPAG